MKQTLEEGVPYDRSCLWQIQDAYFAARGTDAWVGGDIPYMATSNYAAARQHARFVEAVTADHGEPLVVLELGAGLGEFAGNFLRALDRPDRVQYILSDYLPSLVRGAIDTPDMRRRVERGQVIPARYDMREPAALTDLDGAPLEPALSVVLANYVCCVTPPKVVRRSGDRYAEAIITVRALEPLEDVLLRAGRPGVVRQLEVEHGWREAPLAEIVPDEFHRDVVERTLRQYPTGVVRYPILFFDVLRALRGRMAPGGFVLVSDYGSSEAGVMKAIDWRGPDFFGNSLGHGVDFAMFEHFCATAGASVGRTRGPLRSVHTAAVSFSPVTIAFAEAFSQHEQAGWDSDDFLDLVAAARHYATAHDNERHLFRAVRMFQRCLALDPSSAPLHHEAGCACIEAGLFDLADRFLRRSKELDERGELDVAFELGRMYARTGRAREAIACYRESLAFEENAATLANLGLAHMEVGELDEAEEVLGRSLSLAPEYDRAAKLLEQVKERRDQR